MNNQSYSAKPYGYIPRILLGVLFAISTDIHAAGFALTEKSGSSIGNAFAGAGTAAEDASTILSNPAGLSRIRGTQLVVAGYAIRSSIDFHDHDSRTLIGAGVGDPLLSGGSGGDAGDLAFVPNLYLAADVNDHVKAGLGVHSPFGLKTEYDSRWVGRYEAIKSGLKTININPAVSLQVSDRLSLGFGLNAQYIGAELSNAVDFGSICAMAGVGSCAAPQARDGYLALKGKDWSWGYNLGMLLEPVPGTRLGLAYRSKVAHHLKGDAEFSNVPTELAGLPDLANGAIKADITLPETALISVLHQLNDRWSIMGDVLWTRWSQFNELRVERNDGALLGLTAEHWRNVRRYALGATYLYSDAWKLRFGVAYDESPVPEMFRTPRVPDQNRWVLGLGANFKASASDSLDIGYLHVFLKDASLNLNHPVVPAQPAITQSLAGGYDSDVDVLSLQYTHVF
ncbi:OmpP1/FadL family transporter [Methylotenera sp. G11]|uniref:OmpP1/FadL family transporter n=1 Tax=Methylotenera sp. G11 TaxID=1506585 RepID=UPI0009E00952|nr:outer membrane protein transport protein [Methylotenera sp. G11]